MKVQLLPIFLLGCLLLVSACEKEVDIQLPKEEKLVVHSNWVPGYPMVVTLHKSQSIFDTAKVLDPVRNAEIFLRDAFGREWGPFKEVFEPLTNSYVYFTDALIKAESDYQIEVRAQGLPVVKALSKAPAPARILRISNSKLKEIQVKPNVSYYQVNLHMDIQDQAGKEDFYHLICYYQPIEYKINGKDTTRNHGFSYYGMNILEVAGVNDYQTHRLSGQGLFFTDKGRDGQRLQLVINGQSDLLENSHQLFEKTYVELRKVSKDYYMYQLSLNQAASQRDSIFSTPVQVYNNIQGGWGNFAGYSISVDSTGIVR